MFSIVGLIGIGSRVIGFLTSPLGIAVLVGIGIMYIRYDATKQTEQACEANNLRAELVEVRRQQEAAAKVAAEYQKAAEQTAAENEALEKKVKSYEDVLGADDPDSLCKLSDHDIERLRGLQ